MYTYLIFDGVNFAYRLKTHCSEETIKTQRGLIYKELASKFIETVQNLLQFYYSKEVILLFDNYTSKIELKEEFEKGFDPVIKRKKDIKNSYKANRIKEKDEFYLTLDFLRYYYLISKPIFHTVQIRKLEADDLVCPCLETIVKEDTALLITNDMDWAIYLNDKIHYTPNDFYNPVNPDDFKEKYNFIPSKDKIILFKILFGDPSDNIEITYPDIPYKIREKIFTDFSSTKDFLMIDLEKYSYLKDYAAYIKKQESVLKMNEYMLLPININPDLFLSHYTTGRNSERLQHVIETALFKKNEKKLEEYKFGGNYLLKK
ncbi:MAG TPA: hypothetical protein PLI42_01880 [Candidatus Pacearchaeota archaeon]|nr:hypothetical protein [Candidatus Pacearchaeota archaeon]HOS12725.1 hypothetical protein [Candidatus Pacearchaeota archaeon]